MKAAALFALAVALAATSGACSKKKPDVEAAPLNGADGSSAVDESKSWPTEPPHASRVLARLRSPKDFVADGKALYVMDVDPTDENDTADLVKINIADGRTERLATKQRNGQGVAAAGEDLVWIVSGDVDRQIPDAIVRMPKAGGKLSRVTTTFVVTDAALAVQSGALFFHGPLPKEGEGAVTRLSLAAGSVPSKIVPADRNADRQAIAVDASNVYWVETGKIMRAPIAGGTPAQVADARQVHEMVSDGIHLYWTDAGGGGEREGSVRRAPINGGAVETLRQNDTRPWGIAVDDKAVYWVSNGDSDGSVNKRYKHSPPVFGIVANQKAPVRIAVDNANVYWTNAGDGHVMMTSK